MDNFAQEIQEWQTFYATVATASATLVGLLFVSLSINLNLFNRKENADAMHRAQQTFSSFLYILMFSLMFLIPHQGHIGLGLPLLLMGGFGMVGSILAIFKIARQSGDKVAIVHFMLEDRLFLIAYIGLIVVAIKVLLGDLDSLFWLVPVMVIFLISASRNAWYLLVQIKSNIGNDRQ